MPRRRKNSPRGRRLLPALLAPLLLAWQGSGKSEGTVDTRPLAADATAPPDVAWTSIDAVARIDAGSTLLVLVMVLPGERDAVMSLQVRADWGVNLELPSPLVSVVYEEFDRDGRTRFLAREATGTLETVFRTSGAVSLGLALRFEDPEADRALAFSNVAITLIPDVIAPDETEEAGRAAPAGGSLTATSGGCDDDGYEGTTADDGSWDSGSTSDTSGGCDGDTGDSSSDTSSDTSGCEGDDVETGSDSDSVSASDSCDGDASAATLPLPTGASAPRPRLRAPLVAKLVAWLPYLLVLVPLGLRPLRRRLAAVR